MKKQLTIIVAGIFLIFVGAYMYKQMSSEPYKFTHSAASENMIRFAYDVLPYLEKETNLDILLGTNSDPLVLNKNLTLWFQSRGWTPDFTGAKTNSTFLLDGWGCPLFVARYGDLPRQASDGLRNLAMSNNIAIWSSGENRTNDWGNYDDILFVP